MDTIRVDNCYRPLRIGWAVHSGDLDAFRQVVLLSNTLWGGRFNPILVVDREEEADRLIDLFRVDLILPIGDSVSVKEFPKRFPYLINPIFGNNLFIGSESDQAKNTVLDIHNELLHLRDTPDWQAEKEKGFRIYNWQGDDPLRDLFLMRLGAFPNPDEIGIDYREMFESASGATEFAIDQALPVPDEVLEYPSIAFMSKYRLKRHYSIGNRGWDSPGFYFGEVTNFDDLINYWNLGAADIPLWFIDPNHLQRYTNIIPNWDRRTRDFLSHRPEWDRRVGVWSRHENTQEARTPFGNLQLTAYPVDIDLWNGLNLCPPMMHFDMVSTLGVISRERGRPKVSFALNDKPFCSNTWFHTQHLVASLSFLTGLYGDELHTLVPPFVPELNEFYARDMCFNYDKLRIEPERVD